MLGTCPREGGVSLAFGLVGVITYHFVYVIAVHFWGLVSVFWVCQYIHGLPITGLYLQASLAQKRKASGKLVHKVVRRASQQHVLRVNRYLGMMNSGRGLRQFQNVKKLRDLNLDVGCQTGKFPEPMPPIPEGHSVDSVAVCTDQESSQITGGEFIFRPEPNGLACTGVRLIDDFHRWNNDLATSVGLSGLKPVEKAATLFLNIGYGPLQTGAWYHMIIGEGTKLANTLPANSQLLLRFWPRIQKDSKDRSRFGDPGGGEKARADFLAELPEMNLLNLRGTKVTPAQWMSVQIAGHAWDESLSARGLVLASLCLKKGWILTEEDLFAPTRLGATSSGDKPAPKSKAAAVRDATAKLEALKNRQVNVVVSATKLLADVDVVNGFRLLLLAGRSQWTGFNAAISQLTSPDKCLAHCISWANWGWLNDLENCNDCLADATGLNRCGIDTDFSVREMRGLTLQSPEVAYQNALAQRLHRLVHLISSTRAGSLVERSHYYPFRLAGLASEDPTVVESTLKEFERDVKAWWAAKDNWGRAPEGLYKAL
jgi:hypothetical protein